MNCCIYVFIINPNYKCFYHFNVIFFQFKLLIILYINFKLLYFSLPFNIYNIMLLVNKKFLLFI